MSEILEAKYYDCELVKVNTLNRTATDRISAIIGHNMREIDAFECAVDGTTPVKAVHDSIISSDDCFILCHKNKPFIVMGACADHCIWALGTNEAMKHKKAIVKCGLDFIRYATETYGYMFNFISKRNKRALRFITFAGAKLEKDIDLNGEPFVPFMIRGKGEQ